MLVAAWTEVPKGARDAFLQSMVSTAQSLGDTRLDDLRDAATAAVFVLHALEHYAGEHRRAPRAPAAKVTHIRHSQRKPRRQVETAAPGVVRRRPVESPAPKAQQPRRLRATLGDMLAAKDSKR